MSVIDTSELLDYIICPYRFTFKSKPTGIQSISGIKSELYSKLLDYCLYMRVSKQKITTHKLNQRLNYLWGNIKQDTLVPVSISDMLSISKRSNSFQHIFGTVNNVVYYELPRVVKLFDISLLYNLHTYTQDYITKTVVKFDRTHSGLCASSSSLRILASVIKEDLKDLPDTLRHQVYLFRSDTAELYKPDVIPKKELDPIIHSICSGINNKIFFPRNEIINCKSCLWKHQCTWNNIND